MKADAFWRFACETYAGPGIEAACLELQDRHGLDVNLVLLAVWLSRRGLAIEAGAAGEVRAAGLAWQRTVTAPLRAARRNLKAHLKPQDAAVAELRRRVAALELEAERLEGARLVAVLADRAAPGDPTRVFDLNVKRLLGEVPAGRIALERLRAVATDGVQPLNP